MNINVLELLESAAARWPDRVALSGGGESLTFARLRDRARAAGSFLLARGISSVPVLVCMGRRPETVAAYFGAVYAGCPYLPVEEDAPPRRARQILEVLSAGRRARPAAFCDAGTRARLEGLLEADALYDAGQAMQTPPDAAALARARASAIDADPVYTVFTSGSTGVPKGVTACHRNVLDYAHSLTGALGFDGDTVFGVQAPLSIDACLKELLAVLLTGARAVLIPGNLFMFPLKLAEFLNEHEINTLCWTASALTMLSAYGALEEEPLRSVRTVAFGGEAPPPAQVARWRAALPGARLFNLYGPTEATGMSCWYEIPQAVSPDRPVPAGKPFPNTAILLIGEDGNAAPPGETGEIYIRGAGVTPGYWGDPERTDAVFVQNPLHRAFRDPVYRTGDLGRYDENGDLVFVSRRDGQVKHMGRRIELAEIELCAAEAEDVRRACCVHDAGRSRLTLFYEGGAAPAEVAAYLRERLPRYMLPQAYRPVERLPVTDSGKTDRERLKTL
ncbi:MAG: amino acid adenylation domain-containing protein [Oscillospiraceae bacterium]|nr:amino acid adenylation domain-containing protein [Oscillospiraceae bacterium]